MSAVPRLASGPGVRVALPLPPGDRGRPAWRRRAAIGLALSALAAVAVLAAIRTMGPREAGSAPAAPGRRAPPRAAVEAGRAGAQAGAAPRGPEARPSPDRVVAPAHAVALFAQHSWLVLAPAPVPPPPPPPEPTAPPLPFTLLGSFAPDGGQPVYFLAQGDRVIDAHVGDRLDGVYQLESAAGGQLVFVYLPLNVRQNLAAGASR